MASGCEAQVGLGQYYSNNFGTVSVEFGPQGTACEAKSFQRNKLLTLSAQKDNAFTFTAFGTGQLGSDLRHRLTLNFGKTGLTVDARTQDLGDNTFISLVEINGISGNYELIQYLKNSSELRITDQKGNTLAYFGLAGSSDVLAALMECRVAINE